MTRLLLVLALAFASAQEQPITLRGSWAATVGPRTVRGSWTAQPVPSQPDAARGTWALVNEANQVTTSGTWSAAKAERGWTGAWQARVGSGSIISGTWRADIHDPDSAALWDLLQQTTEHDVSGTWASGSLTGAWTIRGTR